VSEGPPTSTEPRESPRTGRFEWVAGLLGDSTGRGILFALLAPIAGFIVALSCLVVPVVGQVVCIIFAGGPGLAQLAWIVPLDRWAAHRGRPRLRKGLWIGASVVFLLNATCWGLASRLWTGPM